MPAPGSPASNSETFATVLSSFYVASKINTLVNVTLIVKEPYQVQSTLLAFRLFHIFPVCFSPLWLL